MKSYNQQKADETGLSYYQVTSGRRGWNLWAKDKDEALQYLFDHYFTGTRDLWPMTITLITQPTKTENGGNNNG